MSDWRNCRWGDLAILEYGKALRGYENADGEYPVYGTNGCIGKHSIPLCDHPGVIIGRKGAYRGIHYSNKPFFVIDTAFYLEPKIEIDLKWAYYELLTHDINGMDSGSAIPSTSRDAFYNLSVRVPPLPEQRAIARILGSLDDKIELNRCMNETLEEMARAIFKSWFVDFDPVRAKSKGQEPAGMDAETAALFPDSFEETEMGMVPKGWRIGRLNELLVLQRGFDLPYDQRMQGPYQVISASGPSGCHIECKVQGPGVTTGRSGLLGKVFFIHEDFWPLNTSLWVKDFLVSQPHHAYFLLKNLGTEAYNAGSAVPTLNRNHIHKLPAIVPPKLVVALFEKLVTPFFNKIQNNQKQSITLAEKRDGLLPELLSGKLRIKRSIYN